MPAKITREKSLQETDPAVRTGITALGVLGALSATVLMGSEILFADAAAIWAVSGFLHLAGAALIVLAGVFSLPAIWACVAVARLAWQVETDPENR